MGAHDQGCRSVSSVTRREPFAHREHFLTESHPAKGRHDVDVACWHLTFRVRSRSETALSPRTLRAWWSAFPDHQGALLTDGTLLLVANIQARDAHHAVLLGRHRVTEFFPGSNYSLENLTLWREEW